MHKFTRIYVNAVFYVVYKMYKHQNRIKHKKMVKVKFRIKKNVKKFYVYNYNHRKYIF